MLLFRKTKSYSDEIRNSLCCTLEQMLNGMVGGSSALTQRIALGTKLNFSYMLRR